MAPGGDFDRHPNGWLLDRTTNCASVWEHDGVVEVTISEERALL